VARVDGETITQMARQRDAAVMLARKQLEKIRKLQNEVARLRARLAQADGESDAQTTS
jgi:hypothetical protein